MMTNWTDLIDTDPVGAYDAWHIAASDWTSELYRRNTRRLLSNLAALCEALAEQLATAHSVIDEQDDSSGGVMIKPQTMLRRRLDAIDSWSEGGPPVNDSTDDVCRDALDTIDEAIRFLELTMPGMIEVDRAEVDAWLAKVRGQ